MLTRPQLGQALVVTAISRRAEGVALVRPPRFVAPQTYWAAPDAAALAPATATSSPCFTWVPAVVTTTLPSSVIVTSTTSEPPSVIV